MRKSAIQGADRVSQSVVRREDAALIETGALDYTHPLRLFGRLPCCKYMNRANRRDDGALSTQVRLCLSVVYPTLQRLQKTPPNRVYPGSPRASLCHPLDFV
ncbi:hypothetical protein FQA47_013953 [Oryzias melastigma]|uniref:Uncharacterized protein n=1 Tax=Oryzias melastigma TaxID=30732 RepID=A0A834FB04_ORYME|nr:hypothetical protein FQA47_013953 [Oryzias melastigma]